MEATAAPILVEFAARDSGGLVFGGDTNRRIAAFDATSGNTLWELPLNSQPGGFQMTYMAGGKQYVAIASGTDPTSGKRRRANAPELNEQRNATVLYVFGL